MVLREEEQARVAATWRLTAIFDKRQGRTHYLGKMKLSDIRREGTIRGYRGGEW